LSTRQSICDRSAASLANRRSKLSAAAAALIAKETFDKPQRRGFGPARFFYCRVNWSTP